MTVDSSLFEGPVRVIRQDIMPDGSFSYLIGDRGFFYARINNGQVTNLTSIFPDETTNIVWSSARRVDGADGKTPPQFKPGQLVSMTMRGEDANHLEFPHGNWEGVFAADCDKDGKLEKIEVSPDKAAEKVAVETLNVFRRHPGLLSYLKGVTMYDHEGNHVGLTLADGTPIKDIPNAGEPGWELAEKSPDLCSSGPQDAHVETHKQATGAKSPIVHSPAGDSERTLGTFARPPVPRKIPDDVSQGREPNGA